MLVHTLTEEWATAWTNNGVKFKPNHFFSILTKDLYGIKSVIKFIEKTRVIPNVKHIIKGSRKYNN